VWDRLRAHVAVEREQLRHLFNSHRPLLVKCDTIVPDTIELSALAALLHSFYTGIENMFKRVIVEGEEELPSGPVWHRRLLVAMTQPGPHRPAVISEPLAETLREYLDFRHVFRQAYAFELQWEKMSHLVQGCGRTLSQLERELDVFLAALEAG
jgi:hypothetical protein